MVEISNFDKGRQGRLAVVVVVAADDVVVLVFALAQIFLSRDIVISAS